jgi:hypothetical protein
MAENISQAGDPQAEERARIMADFNNSIGLTSMPKVDGFDPRPSAIDDYENVVGNPVTGSNPALKGLAEQSLAQQLKSIDNYKNNLNDLTNRVGQANSTNTQMMRPFTYNGDFDGANFERYYSSAPFKKLGFNPYRDNDTLYNNNMTSGDEFVRAASQWPSLVATGFSSGVRAWGTLFTDPLASDVKGAREMQKAMAIGSSTKEGVASFFTNTFLNSGYTIGIGAEMLAETAALWGATALTGGLDSAVTLPAWMTRMGQGAKALAKGAETIETAKKLSKVSQIKAFWDANKYGKALGVIGKSLNPLENTWEVGKGIASGANSLEYLNKSTGTINRFAQASANFGEFAKDIIMTKGAVSEAQLEGGMVKLDVTKSLIEQYRAKNGGKDPEGEELRKIEGIAGDEANRTAFWNLPAIMWSNKFMYETLFAPFEKTAKKGLSNLAKDVLFKETKDASGKVIGKFSATSAGLMGTVEKIGAGIKSPKAWGKFGYAYLKENSAEGVQENLQEAISMGAKSHALATYDNLERGPYEGYMGHFMTGMKAQFSAQGAETFAGGFVMGAMAHPFMAAPMWSLKTAYNSTLGKEQYQNQKKQRKEQLDKTVKTLNEFYNDLPSYLAPDLVNAVKQGQLQKDFVEANSKNNRNEADNIKFVSAFEHIYTAMSTGKLDMMLDKFSKMKDLSPEDAAKAFKVEDGNKALSLIDDITKRAETIKKNYDEVSSSYPNPFNPTKYNKGTEEYNATYAAYAAWEEATKNFVFARTDFEAHSERISKIADALIGARNPIKNANAQDLFVLLDQGQLKSTLRDLAVDIKNADQSTAEGRKIHAEKTKKAALLSDLSYHFNLQVGPMVESARKASEKKTKSLFSQYINHVSKTTGDVVFDSELDHALQLIKDNHILRDERAGLVRSINVLNNPKGFLHLHEALQSTITEIKKNTAKNTAVRLKKFMDDLQQNESKNELYKHAAVFLTPDYSLKLEKALKNNTVIPTPTAFVDAKDPNLSLITDVNDPKFVKAMEVWTKLADLMQSENPIEEAKTIEDITRERDEKLNAIKVDILKLNQNDIFYTRDKKYVITTKGTSLKDTFIGEPPFGDDFLAAELRDDEDTYREDPKAIFDEYEKKLAELKPEVVDEESEDFITEYPTTPEGFVTKQKEEVLIIEQTIKDSNKQLRELQQKLSDTTNKLVNRTEYLDRNIRILRDAVDKSKGNLNVNKSKLQRYQNEYDSLFTTANTLKNGIREVKAEIDQLEDVRDDLLNSIQYYTDIILTNPDVNLTELKAKRNKLQGKISTIENLIQKLKEFINSSLAALKDIASIIADRFSLLTAFRKENKYFTNVKDNNKIAELIDLEKQGIINKAGKTMLVDFAGLNEIHTKLEDEVADSLEHGDIVEESIAIENKKLKELQTSLDKYLRQMRYLNDIIDYVKEDIKQEPIAEVMPEEIPVETVTTVQTKIKKPRKPRVAKPKKTTKGHLIYATAGSGKSTYVKANSDTFVDADELLIAEIKRQLPKFETIKGEDPRKTLLRFSNPNEHKGKWKAVYDVVGNQIQELLAEGKNVLTGSRYFIKDADKVLLQTEMDIIKGAGLTEAEVNALRYGEKKALNEAGKQGTPFTGYYGEKPSKKPRKTKAKKETTPTDYFALVDNATSSRELDKITDQATAEDLYTMDLLQAISKKRDEFTTQVEEQESVQKISDEFTKVIIDDINENVHDFDSYDANFNENIKNAIELPLDNQILIEKAYSKKREELMNKLQLRVLLQAQERGYNIIFKGATNTNLKPGIYPIFDVNLSDKSLTIQSPGGTETHLIRSYDLADQIDKITTMSTDRPTEAPVTVTPEIKEEIKDAVKGSTTILSSAALQAANELAKTKNVEQANKEWEENLGCE